MNVSELGSTPDSLLAKVWHYVPLNIVAVSYDMSGHLVAKLDRRGEEWGGCVNIMPILQRLNHSTSHLALVSKNDQFDSLYKMSQTDFYFCPHNHGILKYSVLDFL